MPIDRGSIDEQLRNIGEGDRWWEQREFRELPYVMQADETIHGLVFGKLLGPRRPRLTPAPRWLVIATDQRLICLAQERFGRKQVDLRMGQITGMRQKNRLRGYQITVETPQRTYRIRIPKADAARFLTALSPLIPQPPALLPAPAPAPAAAAAPYAADDTAVLPGLSRLAVKAARIVGADYATRADVQHLETTVERLEGEVERLREQVDFMEELLRTRAEATLEVPGSTARR